MIDNKIDISVVVTAHHEGRLVHRTMRSLFRSVKYATEKGITTEIIVVMDRPDKNTENYFSIYKGSEILIQKVDYGDPASSRNYGVKQASGNYIAFLDADNLFAENWLFEAFVYLENSADDIVVHPEYHVIFDDRNVIWHQISSISVKFKVLNLIEFNYWDTVCITKRDILLKYPHEMVSKTSGFGFEDWHWNCQTLAEGIEHHVVPGTVHFLRSKRTGSQLAYDLQSNRFMRPTKLFDSLIYAHRLESDNSKEKQEKQPANAIREEVSIKMKILRFMSRRSYNFRCRFYKPLRSFMKYVYLVDPRLRRLVAAITEATETISTANLPDWLISEWKAIHDIEPQIFPEKRLIKTIPYYKGVPESRIGKHYLELCKSHGDNVSHVFLVPWITRGGADIVTLNYIKGLIDNNFATGITVISTLNADSPWSSKLPQKVRFVEFGKQYSHLSDDEQEKLLTRLLLQMAPSIVHNINSELGYRIFVKYGKALNNVSKLYVTSFCADLTEEEKSVGYPFTYLPECFDYLTAMATDTKYFCERLQQIYAFDRQKMFVHYQPAELVQCRKSSIRVSDKKHFDILWAGRIDRQKRPDILFKIANECQNLPFRFHIYGVPILDSDIYVHQLKKLKNVTCYGAFEGLASLPVEQYDIFLFTSQWEGMPTILFDAISFRLPIIASNVGGVSELIIDGKTGFLVDPYDDVNMYIKCLHRAYEDRDILKTMIEKAFNELKTRHSLENFIEEIKRFPDYIVTRTCE